MSNNTNPCPPFSEAINLTQPVEVLRAVVTDLIDTVSGVSECSEARESDTQKSETRHPQTQDVTMCQNDSVSECLVAGEDDDEHGVSQGASDWPVCGGGKTDRQNMFYLEFDDETCHGAPYIRELDDVESLRESVGSDFKSCRSFNEDTVDGIM